jgi:hypothetical protein
MLLVQLFNDRNGSITLDDVDPKGLSDIENEIKRGDDNDGVVYEISVNLEYTKKGRRFLQTCYETDGGIESRVIAYVYQLNENTRKWELYYEGQVKMPNYDISEVKLRSNIDQIGFQVRVVNLQETDVDIETLFSQGGAALPETPSQTTTLHPKKIIKTFNSTPIDSVEYAQLDVFEFEFQDDGDTDYRNGVVVANIDTNKQVSKELEQSFAVPWFYQFLGENGESMAGTIPVVDFLQANLSPRNEIYRATEAGVASINIRQVLRHAMHARNDGGDVDFLDDDGCLGDVKIQLWFERRNVDNTIIQLTPFGPEVTRGGRGGFDWVQPGFATSTYSQLNIPVAVGEKWYVYFTCHVFGNYEEPNEGIAGHGHVWHEFRVQANSNDSFINITNETVFPATTAKTFLVHEVLRKLAQYMTDQVDCFYSDFFGRIDSSPVYAADGEGSLMAVTNGGNIRKLLNKKVFINWKDIVGALNSLWCLSWGFETIDGVQRIRVEKKSHFYDKNTLVLEMGRVDNLHKVVDMKYYYSQVEIGYPKIEAGQINGVDEFNTVRRFKPPLTQAKTKLSLRSLFRASGFEIEAQRRLIESTKDSKIDDDNFFICVRRDGGSFVPEKNEDFPIVNNVYDPGSSYNLRITPTQNFIRHSIVWASNVIRQVNKLFKFTYGEINYIAQTKKTGATAIVNEDGDVDVTGVEPLWYPERYEFEAALRSDEFKLIRQNPYGFIRFRDNLDNIHEGYILSVMHKPEARKGKFSLLRVFRPS